MALCHTDPLIIPQESEDPGSLVGYLGDQNWSDFWGEDGLGCSEAGCLKLQGSRDRKLDWSNQPRALLCSSPESEEHMF